MSDSRARILFLVPQAPYPPEQGTALRNYNLIRETSRRHAVGVLTFADEPSDSLDLGETEPESIICAQAVTHPSRTIGDRLRSLFVGGRPDMGDRLASGAFAAALRALLHAHTFDVVQIEGIEMARYGQDVRAWLGPDGPAIVFDDHNAEYVLQKRACHTDARRPGRWPYAAYSLIQWLRLRRFERDTCLDADATLCVSQADRAALLDILPVERLSGGDVTVVHNGVDVGRYRPGLSDGGLVVHPAVVFTGKMDYRPNIDAVLWFHDEVWPLIRAERPEARFYVVGKGADDRISRAEADPSVTVTGRVPDVLPYFAGADAYIVPMRIGGGTRLKVLEALATGCAMVTTSLGCEGINLSDGAEALIADAPADFAAAVLVALENAGSIGEMRHNARQFALREYDWRNIVPRLEPIYSRLLRERQGR